MKQVIEKLAEDFNLTKKLAKEVVDSVVASITDEIKAGGVKLSGIGTLTIVEKAEKKGRNPKTGEAITIPARKAVKFKVSKTLKDSL